MPKTYTITEENAREIRQLMKAIKSIHIYRKLEAVALRGEGKSNTESGQITGYHPKRVSQLVSIYCNEGLEAIASDGRKGGNHKNFSRLEERKLLESFKEKAMLGQIITPSDIKRKYDEALGRETAPQFIYAVLKRNGWRMVMPRSKHPKKANEAEIEASKKLTKSTEN